MYENELEAKLIPIDDIYLDPNNPRFTDLPAKVSDKRTPEDAVQRETLERIYKEGVEELIGSILHNGFLPLDRIVVRPLAGSKGYVVVEGNRRMAALKTIIRRIETAQIDEDEFPEERQNALKESIRKINCLVYTGTQTKDIAWILQGIRHISGIRDWSPAQRAELVSREIDENKLHPRQVAHMLGITTQQVNRLYRANRGLRQMFEDEEYGARAKKEYFTLFEEANSKKYVREWLGWDPQREQFTNDENLKTFYELISPDPDRDSKRRIHDPRQVASLDKLIRAGRGDLIDKVIEGELDIDEAKGRLDESESQVNWREQIQRATKALDQLPATALANQPGEVISSLENLHRIVSQLLNAAKHTGGNFQD